MQTTTKHSRNMTMSLINEILAVILLIEIILLAGVIGYRIGKESACVQPVYQFTLQIDSGTIEHEEENNPKPEKEANDQAPVKDINNEVKVIEPVIENLFTNEEIDHITKTVWGEARG